MKFNIEKMLPTLLTAIVTIAGSFFVFQIDFKKTDNQLLNINAENFQKLYEYQDTQIRVLNKRVDSLAAANMILREEITNLKIAHYKRNHYETASVDYNNMLNHNDKLQD